MARLPASMTDLVAQFGPHLHRAIASGGLFALGGGLLWYVVSFDARLRQWGRRD